MRGRRGGVFAANPVMIGAITVLVVIVTVFLAYNANRGLPFVPTYRLSAQVPNAAQLVPGNEVRIAGVRVGVVDAMEPVAHRDGSSTARLDLTLDDTVEPLPADSTIVVRTQSALGLKYLEIVKGKSEDGYPEGSVLPLSAARPEPVDIDEVLNVFDEPTREAIQSNLVEFGNAVAARGPSLNSAIGDLAPLVRRLEPVMRVVGAPRTRLEGFVAALRETLGELAPVADVQARLVANLDTTFGAFARVARPYIQDAISKSPPTLGTAISSLPTIRPFLTHGATLFETLQPGTLALRRTSPTLARAIVDGIPALRASPSLNAELDPTAQSLLEFSQDAGVRRGLEQLTQVSSILTPTLRFVTPAQSVCNYATLLGRNGASLLSLGDGVGTWQRFITFDVPKGENSEGSPSSAPANGPGANFAHANPYPNTASPGQERECEAGNEPYIAGQQVIGNVPGNQGIETEDQAKSQTGGGGKGKGG